MHTHMHMHVHMHSHVHMHAHAHAHVHMHVHMHVRMHMRKRKMPQVAATALPSSPGRPATVCLFLHSTSASVSVDCTTASVPHRWLRGCATSPLRRRAPCAKRSGGTSVASFGGAPRGSRTSSPIHLQLFTLAALGERVASLALEPAHGKG